jgi:hypothetical protein
MASRDQVIASPDRPIADQSPIARSPMTTPDQPITR